MGERVREAGRLEVGRERIDARRTGPRAESGGPGELGEPDAPQARSVDGGIPKGAFRVVEIHRSSN